MNTKEEMNKEKIEFMVLPHDCYAKPRGGQSISDIFNGIIKTRMMMGSTLNRGARLNRVAILHKALNDAPDGKPYLQFLPKVENTLRTLPLLVHDENNPEDVDTTGEDHPYDAISMLLVSLRDKYKLFSGALGIKKPIIATKKTFVLDERGRIYSPDFASAFAKREKKKGSRQIENN